MSSPTLLQEVLADGGLMTLFQPIFEISSDRRTRFAVEALSRGPAGSNAERADVLFEYVRRKGKEIEVDRACTSAALKAAAATAVECAVSINVHASTLERDDRWVEFLTEACAAHGVPLTRLILEIVEQQKFWDERRFFRTLEQLRWVGVRIAVDDIGLGYSNYRLLIEIRPEFFKIDPYFVTSCANKPEACAAIESIRVLADRLGGQVIAEGIESESDVRTLGCLGIHLLQGFYLAPPQTVAREHAMCAE
ncbi:MAG TPA: EAL domain-containing protein [Thermoanaerobaculia bacterium]|nr:EAL domain-containing protein [Thermoanaerobaculia bacterium]